MLFFDQTQFNTILTTFGVFDLIIRFFTETLNDVKMIKGIVRVKIVVCADDCSLNLDRMLCIANWCSMNTCPVYPRAVCRYLFAHY